MYIYMYICLNILYVNNFIYVLMYKPQLAQGIEPALALEAKVKKYNIYFLCSNVYILNIPILFMYIYICKHV